MEPAQPGHERGELDRAPHFVAEPAVEEAPAWEQIAEGRYMPRRIRGSCRGRALG
jgi:hypothetical protein